MVDDRKSNQASELANPETDHLIENLLNQFWDLIVTFAGRWDSVRHSRISLDLKAAVDRGNREELLSRLHEFGEAKNDFMSPKKEAVMRGCLELTQIIIDTLSILEYDQIPWQRLANLLVQAKTERDNLDRKIL